MAAARLRRTFHYPTESDDEDAVEAGMDEQGTQHSLHIWKHSYATPTYPYILFKHSNFPNITLHPLPHLSLNTN
jgi:hypothetical protein